MKIFLNPWIAILFSLIVMGTSLTATAADVRRISKEDLRAMTDKTDVIIIDVRSRRDWKSSDLIITGAIREEPNQAASWALKYDRQKTYVLYCA